MCDHRGHLCYWYIILSVVLITYIYFFEEVENVVFSLYSIIFHLITGKVPKKKQRLFPLILKEKAVHCCSHCLNHGCGC